MSAVNTRLKDTFIASWLRFTSLNHQNWPQKSLAQLHVPSKIVGGTPLIPPLGGGFAAGVVMVTFTDIVGGSNGNDPCKDTTGLSVAASASSMGFSTGTNSSLVCSLSGPQVVWFCSDPDSDMTGDGV